MSGRVLAIAESDSSGGAGIQADIKTVLAFGGYAATAVAGMTAQNTRGIMGFQAADPDFVAQQIRVVLDDMNMDVIKTGLLGNESIINAVSDILDELQDEDYKVVVDPCIVARNGQPLLDMDTIATLKRRLLVRAHVLTPNRREAELLTGMTIKDLDDMRHATEMMLTFGAEAVVLKGGQITGIDVVDLVATEDGDKIFESAVVQNDNTHGAGCTLAAGIAACLAQGQDVFAAVENSLSFLNEAIRNAEEIGQGAGPVNHAYKIQALS